MSLLMTKRDEQLASQFDWYGPHLAWRGIEVPGVTPALAKPANLSGANLSGANLSGADLYRANLSGANLSGADLYRTDLYRANLSGANLSGADLYRANLSGANLSGANLSGADLYRANLSGADLSGANLSGANLSGANLSGAKGIVSFGPVGTAGRIGYVVAHPDSFYVQLGCWWDTLERTLAELREKRTPAYVGIVQAAADILIEQKEGWSK